MLIKIHIAFILFIFVVANVVEDVVARNVKGSRSVSTREELHFTRAAAITVLRFVFVPFN